MSKDVPFLRVARFLLHRMDVSLVASSGSGGLDELERLILRHRPRIVLLDAETRVGGAVSTAESLRARHPHLEVAVLVDRKDAETRAPSGGAVFKWGCFQSLAEEFEARWADPSRRPPAGGRSGQAGPLAQRH